LEYHQYIQHHLQYLVFHLNVHQLVQPSNIFWPDNFDLLELPNEYDYFAKSRKHFSQKSGGIVILKKTKKLQKYLRFIKSESEFVQWIDISKDISSFGQNILLGCTN
jgi:hypothetical protein